MASPSDELVKEMYAQFGLTYSHSEDLCIGLGIFYVLNSFVNANDMTKPRIEEKFVEVESLTLGQVIDKVRSLVPPDLQPRLDEALEKRNYLAHSFWNERVPDMVSEEGVIKLINELRESGRMFEELDSEISKRLAPRIQELGLTDEVLENSMQRTLAGEIEPPLPNKHPLSRRQVRIVQAYNIVLDNGGLAQVLETGDGEFLQFCDVGLGWSNFTEVTANWKINEALQPYLPANIVPRPEVIEPWNYEFRLPRNAVLWVRKGRAEKTFRWGIRSAKKPTAE